MAIILHRKSRPEINQDDCKVMVDYPDEFPNQFMTFFERIYSLKALLKD